MSIITSYPFILQNGTIADATQVMADFNTALNEVNANAAHNGVNGDITALNALASFISTTGTVTGNFSVGGILTVGGDVRMTGTGQLDLPSGTTAQRSGAPNTGMIRYNTTLSVFEGYGAFGWQVIGPTSFPMASGLTIANNSSVPDTSIDVTCAHIQLVASTYQFPGVTFDSFFATIDSTVNGVNGLDTGTIAPSTWYFVWAISNGPSIAGLLSLSAVSPALPSGYVYAARIGAFLTDGSGNFRRIIQRGNVAQYTPVSGSNTTSYPFMAGGGSGFIPVTDFIPPTAGRIKAYVIAQGAGTISALKVDPQDAIVYAIATTSTEGTSSTHADIVLEIPYQLAFEYTPGGGGNSGSAYCVGWADTILAS